MIHPNEKFNWIDQDRVVRPQSDQCETLKDFYWLVNSDGQVCLYKSAQGHPLAPQGNRDRSISERFVKSTPGAVGIQHIPLAFVPLSLEES